MLMTQTVTQLDIITANLEAWLETTRTEQGYGGPVAHWWQQSLLYTGAGLDWRYEGIIAAYLQMWERTQEARWLDKACRAANDLLNGQLESGHYLASGFEINPATAGTPHEAAADVGLLLLALALQQVGRDDWERYAACAESNMRGFYLKQLWDEGAKSFRDMPGVASFVPNKAATACDAFFLLAEISGDEMWVVRYALPTLDRILEHQVGLKVSPLSLHGAVAQNSFGKQKIEKYFPIYNARCVSALLRGYEWTKQERYLAAASRIMEFIKRWARADGSLPTVVYANGKTNDNPNWLAPLGDVLRAADELLPYGFTVDMEAVLQRFLDAQDSSGGFQTATGFAAQAGGKLPLLPDVRDVLHVTGWCDKAFRYLAAHVSAAPLPAAESRLFETNCIFRGKKMHFIETPELVEICDVRKKSFLTPLYRWRKGQNWAEVATAEFWLR